MKIFITNKDQFDQDFNQVENEKYKTSGQIHKSLFNKISTDLLTENKIEILVYISHSDIYDGDAIFEFIGKNKDVFFYTYNGTIK